MSDSIIATAQASVVARQPMLPPGLVCTKKAQLATAPVLINRRRADDEMPPRTSSPSALALNFDQTV